jgi:nucleotidyltransferase/DNA polymerase involved in DNA repair
MFAQRGVEQGVQTQPATSAKMNSLGLYTGLDMRNQTLDFMQANFGKVRAYYYWISRGVDDREVRANRIRKSVGAENRSPPILPNLAPWPPNCNRSSTRSGETATTKAHGGGRSR